MAAGILLLMRRLCRAGMATSRCGENAQRALEALVLFRDGSQWLRIAW